MKASAAMIGSAVFYSFQYLDIQLQATTLSLSVWESSFYRGVSGAVVALLLHGICWCRRAAFWGKEKRALHTRGAIGGLSFLGTLVTLRHLSLPVATTVLSLSPFWTACCSPILFRRQSQTAPRFTGGYERVGILLCVLGVVLLFVGSMSEKDASTISTLDLVVGLLAAMGSTLCQSVVNMSISSVTLKDEPPFLLSLYPMVYTAIPGMVMMIVKSTGTTPLPPNLPLTWWLVARLSSTGVLAVGAQVLRVVALQNSSHVGITIWRFLDVPLSLLLEHWVLRGSRSPSGQDMAGMLLITVGCMIPPACRFTTGQKTTDGEGPATCPAIPPPPGSETLAV